MSLMMMDRAFKVRVGNPARKLVLVKLADNANDNGECWPSYGHIARECEMGKSTVRAHIKALEDAGYLVINNRRNGGINKSNMYQLTLDKGAPIERAKPSRPGGKKKPALDEVYQPLAYISRWHRVYQPLIEGVSAADRGVYQPLTPEPVIKNLSLNLSLNRMSDKSDEGTENDFEKLFDRFWQAGMRKDGKKPSREKFVRLMAKQDDPEAFTDKLVFDITARLAAGVPGFDRLHPKTYLHQQRWEDELPEICPHAEIIEAWNEELPSHIEKVSPEDWTPDSNGFQALATAWESFKTKPRASTGKPVFEEQADGVRFYREVFRKLAKLDRIQREDATRWCRLSWAVRQQETVRIFKGELA